MKLIAGLGNPGPEYVFSRHNIGWLVVDHLVARWSCGPSKLQFSSMVWMFFRNGEKVFLLKPLTYMNLSGAALQQATAYYEIPWDEVLVVFDDVALPFGKLRMRKKGSAGGHNGMRSVLGAARSLEVPRLRVGVGATPQGSDMSSWVLGRFSREERDGLPSILDAAADAVDAWCAHGTDYVMNRINGCTTQQEG